MKLRGTPERGDLGDARRVIDGDRDLAGEVLSGGSSTFNRCCSRWRT
jgi:hypothetical protein